MKPCFLFMLLLTLVGCETAPTYVYDLPFSREENLKLCFIGDTGSGTKIQRKVSELLSKEGCESVYFLGDLIYPKGIDDEQDPEAQEKFFSHYTPVTKLAPFPKLHLVMGNHDHRKNSKAWLKLADSRPELFYPNPYYLELREGLCVVAVDTNYYKIFKEFWKGLGQITWLTGLKPLLKESCDTTIFISHHPYLSRGKHHGPASGLLKFILEKYVIGEFDYFIAGHDHILSDEGVRAGTRFLVSGGGGEPEKHEKAGYLVLTVDPATKKKVIRYEFRTLPE